MAAYTNRTCAFCSLSGDAVKYTCPRCNAPFCSAGCYAGSAHSNCSEDFYKEWVHAQLKSNGDVRSSESKQQILQILEMLGREEESPNDNSYHDDKEATLDISDRFAEIDIENDDDLKVETIWSRLTESEKNEFKRLVDTGEAEKLLPIWRPWWTGTVKSRLIHEINDVAEVAENLGLRPKIPTTIARLETLTSATPSGKIKYNVTNTLYVYAFVTRFYNGDLFEFPVETAEAITEFGESLGKNVIFNDVEQAVLSAMKQIQQKRETQSQRSLALIAVKDVINLIKGPVNGNPSGYVLSALSDLRTLFEKCHKLLKTVRHEFKVKVKPIQKKLDYYMSWTNEYHNELISTLLELDLVQASLAADWASFEGDCRRVENQRILKSAKKRLIEEIN